VSISQTGRQFFAPVADIQKWRTNVPMSRKSKEKRMFQKKKR